MFLDAPSQRWISTLVVTGCLLLGGVVLLSVVQRARHAAHVSQSRNNLRQFGIALYNYHDTWRCLPPGGVFRSDATPMHGWPGLIRPFIDASPWYSQLDLNFPWNHPVNVDLYQQRPAIDRVPTLESDLLKGGFPATHYPANPSCMFRNSSVNWDDLPAGTSHTWLLQERVVDLRPWGDPCNWAQLPETSEQALAENRSRGWDSMQILLADGSVWSQPTMSEHPRWKALGESLPMPASKDMRQEPASYSQSKLPWPPPQGMSLNTPDPEETLIAEIAFDEAGVEQSVRFWPSYKWCSRSATPEELSEVASRYSRIRVLHGSPLQVDHDDELLKLFPQLEYVNKLRLPVDDADGQPGVPAE